MSNALRLSTSNPWPLLLLERVPSLSTEHSCGLLAHGPAQLLRSSTFCGCPLERDSGKLGEVHVFRISVAQIESFSANIGSANKSRSDATYEESLSSFRQNQHLSDLEAIEKKITDGEQRYDYAWHYKIPYPRLHNFATGTTVELSSDLGKSCTITGPAYEVPVQKESWEEEDVNAAFKH